MELTHTISYQSFDQIDQLPKYLQQVAQAAYDAVKTSYAPYSHFHVGAAILTSDGSIIKGSNQENANLGNTICAERTALGTFGSIEGKKNIQVMAVTYDTAKLTNFENILSPCGSCRQSIMEYRNRQKNNIQILLLAPSGNSYLFEDIYDLLPFAFTSSDLNP